MIRRARVGAVSGWTAALLAAAISLAHAHSGPPFPVVSNRIAGAYDVSIWTDPDATDDGSAAGQFWIVLQLAQHEGSLPDGTQATVTIEPLDRSGLTRTGRTEPVDHQLSRQFVALVMDHEGPFAVRVEVSGPLGKAEVGARVEATYDMRPPPMMVAVYLMPFLLVGFLWLKLLVRRRGTRKSLKADS